MKIALLLLFAFSSLGMAQSPTLPQLKETFQTQYKRIDDERKLKRLTGGDKYVGMLSKLESGFQVAGQFEPMQAVKKERERWSKALRMSPKDVVNFPAELQALQEQFLQSLSGMEVESARKLLSLGSQYRQLLLTMQGNLTKAGNVDEASLVNQELKALEANRGIAQAKQWVAQAAAEAPVPVAVHPNPVPASTTPRVFRESDGVRLQSRYRDFWDALANKEGGKALGLMDPVHIKKVGQNGVKPHLALMQGVVGAAKGLGVTLTKTDVVLDATKTRATLTPTLNNPFTGESKGDPSQWILVQGDWYVDLVGGGKAQNRPAPKAGPGGNAPNRFKPRKVN